MELEKSPSFSIVRFLSSASRWALVFLWMAGISYFSSRPYPLGPLSRSEYTEVIGRVCHFMEYAGLAILVHRALSGGRSGQEEQVVLGQSGPLVCRGAYVCTFLISFFFALFDEFHQGFVPGRGAELPDVVLDVAGICTPLMVIRNWHRFRGEGHATEGR